MSSIRALLMAATERELRPLVRLSGARREERPSGKLAALELRFETIGVGKANAALNAYRLMRERDRGLAILVGCAGAYPRSDVVIGDVVLATSEVFADEGVRCEDGFLDLKRLGLPLAHMADGTALYNEIPVVSPPLGGSRETGRDRSSLDDSRRDFTLRHGRIATVSTGSGTPERAVELFERWQPLAEAMEGAAAALAALAVGWPFIEIRGISNLTGVRSRDAWDIDGACENAARVAIDVLEGLDGWFRSASGESEA